MDKDFLQLIIKLNECSQLASHAAKNALFMEQSFISDITKTEYLDKVQRMSNELPYLIRRVNDLQQHLEKFNRIAMS